MKKFIITFIVGISIGLIPAAFAIGALAGRFSDVPDDVWYSNAVNNLAANGIVTGYDDGTFGPSKNINRAELAVILDRTLNYLETGLASNHFVYCADGRYTQSVTGPDEKEIGTMANLFNDNELEYRNFNNCHLREMVGPLKGTEVSCDQFVNGLKLFYEELEYRFNEYAILYPSGIHGNEIIELDLDNRPSMSKEDVIDLFNNEINNDVYLTPYEKQRALNGCYELEFGYYHLNSGSFTKAWRIDSKDVPPLHAFINDTTSEIIYYDNGGDPPDD
ncbi:S-layer homology domain-containing protein [Candidatus Peregrinibacteria bacterium]|nr:S-layer homology domain-containing protein [Candidatus Peregrinibacteria bacterium]